MISIKVRNTWAFTPMLFLLRQDEEGRCYADSFQELPTFLVDDPSQQEGDKKTRKAAPSFARMKINLDKVRADTTTTMKLSTIMLVLETLEVMILQLLLPSALKLNAHIIYFQGRYRRLDRFQEDLFQVFEYARQYSRSDSQVRHKSLWTLHVVTGHKERQRIHSVHLQPAVQIHCYVVACAAVRGRRRPPDVLYSQA